MGKIVEFSDSTGRISPNLRIDLGRVQANTIAKIEWSSDPIGILVIIGSMSSCFGMFAVVGYGKTLGSRFRCTKISEAGGDIVINGVTDEVAITVQCPINAYISYIPFNDKVPRLTIQTEN